MREKITKKDEGAGLISDTGALEVNSHSLFQSNGPPKTRSGSAPPLLDSSSLFLYLEEDDVYTRSFTKGPIIGRKDSFHENYDNYKVKCPTTSQTTETLQGSDPNKYFKHYTKASVFLYKIHRL